MPQESASTRKEDRDEVFVEFTKSIRPLWQDTGRCAGQHP